MYGKCEAAELESLVDPSSITADSEKDEKDELFSWAQLSGRANVSQQEVGIFKEEISHICQW